jgi:ABC-type antimicrobial peptide transport system permease subunit
MLGIDQSIPSICSLKSWKGDFMKLYLTYLKLILNKNKMNYIFVILSIMVSLLTIAVISIYIDNILAISKGMPSEKLRYIFGSIQTIFCLAAVSYVLNQYYTILKSDIRDFSLIKAFGATKQDLRILILFEVVLLIVFTIPLGVFGGIVLVNILLYVLPDMSLRTSTIALLDYSAVSLVISAIIICFIIITGIKIEVGIRKISPSQILSENSIFGKEV